MNRATATLLCAALVAGCQSSESPTAPATDIVMDAAGASVADAVIHTKQRVEVINDDVYLNECSGELMQFHFNQLLVAHDLEIVGRALHAKIVQVDRGSNGVGLTTGARYRQVGKQGGTFFISARIDEVQTFTATGGVIGAGGAPDLLVHITYHITVGPSGRLIVEFEKARFTCK